MTKVRPVTATQFRKDYGDDVFGTDVGILKLTGFACALTLVGGIIGDGDEYLLRRLFLTSSCSLLLNAGAPEVRSLIPALLIFCIKKKRSSMEKIAAVLIICATNVGSAPQEIASSSCKISPSDFAEDYH